MTSYKPWNIDYSDPDQYWKMIEERDKMNSFKSKITPGRELLANQYKMEEALRKARAKAEKDIFKQKVAANLIVGGALIVIFLMFYW